MGGLLKGRMRLRLPGFALFELSLALIIMGIIMGVSYPLYQQWRQKTQQETTRIHVQQLQLALANFAYTHGHLPCPAKEFGPKAGLAVPTCGTMPHMIGYVPYRTLGLPEAVAKDGFGFFFTYASAFSKKPAIAGPRLGGGGAARPLPSGGVRLGGRGAGPVYGPPLARPRVHRFCELTPGAALLEVRQHDGRGGEVNVVVGDNKIAMVLVSHGRYGNGAYAVPQNGRRPLKGHDDLIRQNAREDMLFYMPWGASKRQGQQVFWMTQENLFVSTLGKSCYL